MTSPSAMTLACLVERGLARKVLGDPTVQLHGIQHDSRRVQPGDAFVAISGAQVNGSAFAEEALERGAVAIVTEDLLELSASQLLVVNARTALAKISDLVYGRPTHRMKVVGLTGTNGKTSIAYLLEAVLTALGSRPAVIGTIGMRGPEGNVPAAHTTPEGDDLARFARDVEGVDADLAATHLLMEVSSHGLALHRVDGVDFDVVAFTNLTQDHLDFHRTLNEYGEAKARLFTELGATQAVINVDDAFGAALAQRLPIPVLRCSCKPNADAEIRVLSSTFDRSGIRSTVSVSGVSVSLESPLVGHHNLENLLVVLGCCQALHTNLDSACEALTRANGAPGRLERVPHPDDVGVFVDYAHTPDALEHALEALRFLTPGRLIVVFGCGGDRDRKKRSVMGCVAGLGADVAIATSDNPRTESPESILKEIEPGLRASGQPKFGAAPRKGSPRGYCVQEDRREAIALAIELAEPGDTVLIAGKGHEDYQIVGTTKRDFDDRVEAASAIARRYDSTEGVS